jgi:hypothetical protein
MRLLITLIAMAIGVVIELNTFKIVHTFGHLGWAEQRFGPGGSYFAWRLIGIIIIVGALLTYRYLPGF